MFRAIKKSRLNLIIDIIMFLGMFALAGIGFLIKYLLIPGFKRVDIYGKDVELFFLDSIDTSGVIFIYTLLLHMI